MDDAWLEALTFEECSRLLESQSVGRIAVVVNDFPVVFPVNYRLVGAREPRWIALRTRPGNVLDRAPMHAAFEIDALDSAHREGWSVLVRGTLHHADPTAADFRERFDPDPWILDDRNAWLVVEPFSITGRRLHAGEPAWAFHIRSYL